MNLQDQFFEEATRITKAHAYDIVSEQVKQLKAEKEAMRQILTEIKKCIDKDEAIEKHSGIYYSIESILKNLSF